MIPITDTETPTEIVEHLTAINRLRDFDYVLNYISPLSGHKRQWGKPEHPILDDGRILEIVAGRLAE